MSDPAANSPAQASAAVTAARDVHITGDVVGRDKIVHGYAAEQVQGLLTELAARYQPRPFDGRCPYPGLEPFREADAALFFGREPLIQDLVRQLDRRAALVIAGPSGSGKSSLIQAGLIPALKGGALAASARWRYATLTPGRSPLLALGRALTRLTGSLAAQDDLVDHALTDPARLTHWLQTYLAEDPAARAVLVVDPFEEIFTQTAAEVERRAFIAQLCTAAEQATESLRLVFAMRSDFIGACARYPALNALLGQGLIQIGALRPDELLRAIAAPALQVGLRVDPELIARLLFDGQDEPGALPLLQFALRDLFEAERGPDGVPALTLAGYLRRGGLHQALRRHADAVYGALTPEQQALARILLGHLVSVGQSDGAPLARRTARLADLPGDPQATADVIARFTAARLLIVDDAIDGSPSGPTASVTLAHETLLSAWPLLAEWVAAGREAIRLRAAVLDDAAEWARHHHDASYLYAGTRLAVVEDAVRADDMHLPAEAAEFVAQARRREAALAEAAEAARRAELERERGTARQLRTRNRWITGIGVAAVLFAFVALAAGVLAGVSAWNAAQAAATAQAANTETVAQSRIALARSAVLEVRALLDGGHTTSAARLAAQAVRVALQGNPQGIADVNAALYAVAARQAGQPVELPVFGEGERGPATLRVASDPLRPQLATLSSDGRARLWSESGDLLASVQAPEGELRAVAFTGYGAARFASVTPEGQVRVVDQAGQTLTAVQQQGSGPIVFRADGTAFLTTTASAATLWSEDGDALLTLTPADGRYVRQAQFTAAEDAILLEESDGAWALVDLNGRRIGGAQTASRELEQLVISRDGAVVAGVAGDSVWVWDRAGASPAEIPVARADPAQATGEPAVTALALSPDGQTVVIGRGDGAIVLVKDGAQTVLAGHASPITALAVSADGQVIVSGSRFPEGATRLWRLDGTPLAVLGRVDGQSVEAVSFGFGAFQGETSAVVLSVNAAGNPRLWTVYPTLAATLRAVDLAAGGTLSEADCQRLFNAACVTQP